MVVINRKPSHRSRRAEGTSSRSSGEFARIARIARLFSFGQSRVKVGIGDDAAVVGSSGDDLVWTVDSCVEDVHFKVGWLTLEEIGWKSFHAAASDLAAMGARPVGALSALELPRGFDERELSALLRGQHRAAKSLGCPIIGGNLAASSLLSVTTTVLGHARNVLLRSSARVGDELWLVGDVGLAAAGLRCLMDMRRRYRGHEVERCIAAWRKPLALLNRGRALLGRAHAAIDVSDGLVGDAEHLATSSRVAIEIDLERLLAATQPELAVVARLLSCTVMELALCGGEDYALLATGPSSKRPRWAKAIGHVAAGRGVWGYSRQGRRVRMRHGFDHFAPKE